MVFRIPLASLQLITGCAHVKSGVLTGERHLGCAREEWLTQRFTVCCALNDRAQSHRLLGACVPPYQLVPVLMVACARVSLLFRAMTAMDPVPAIAEHYGLQFRGNLSAQFVLQSTRQQLAKGLNRSRGNGGSARFR